MSPHLVRRWPDLGVVRLAGVDQSPGRALVVALVVAWEESPVEVMQVGQRLDWRSLVRPLFARSWPDLSPRGSRVRSSCAAVSKAVIRNSSRSGESEARKAFKIALLGHVASGNIGNDASAEVVLAWLRRECPNVEVTIFTDNPTAAANGYDVECQVISMTPPPARRRWGWHAARRVGLRLLDAPRAALLAGRQDAVVVPGMGVLEDSLPVGPWGFPLSLALMGIGCRLRQKPFILLAIGAEVPTDRRLWHVFKLVSRLATDVSCRDTVSAAALRAWGVAASGVYPDLAFRHEAPVATTGVDPTLIVIGVLGGDWQHIRGGDHGDYLGTLASVAVTLLDEGFRLILAGGSKSDDAVALRLLKVIAERTPEGAQRVQICGSSNFTDLTNVFSAARLVVASRYHNVICALRAARPTIAISYADKCDEVMAQMGQADFVLPVRDLQEESLLRAIRAALAQGDGIHRHLTMLGPSRSSAVDELLTRVLGGVLRASR